MDPRTSRKAGRPEPFDRALSKMKPLWRNRNSRAFAFFCPNCRAQRRVKTHPSPSRVENYFRIGLLTVVFTLAGWSYFGAKGLVSFVPFWAIFEVVFRSRMRVALLCPYCGFDPFLYLYDVDQARAGVMAHWQKVCAEKGIPYPNATETAQPSSDPADLPRQTRPENSLSPPR
jgi:hypothetical protein